jgi:hypothetical protein
VADREEQAGRLDVAHRAGLEVLHPGLLHHPVAQHLGHLVREEDLDLGVGAGPVLHDLRRAQLVTAMDDVDLRPVLGEEARLLHGRVAAADHEQRLTAKQGQGAIAHRARAHALLPQLAVAGAGGVVALGGGAGGDDDHPGHALALVAGVAERPPRQIDPGDGLGVDHRAEAHRLGAEAVAQLGAVDALGEAGEVLDVGGGGELATGGDAPGHPALEQDG